MGYAVKSDNLERDAQLSILAAPDASIAYPQNQADPTPRTHTRAHTDRHMKKENELSVGYYIYTQSACIHIQSTNM